MKLLPMNKLGARETKPGKLSFGLFLPWVSAGHGYRLQVKIIHEKDQFLQNIQPMVFELEHSADQEYSDFWSTEIKISSHDAPCHGSAWGEDGKYVYRYCLTRPGSEEPIDWIIDPFAREYGVGKMSAITKGYKPYEWSPEEKDWKTPNLNDLIIYELMINEFGGDIERTIQRMDYLADMGVNCIEVMPLSNVTGIIDWGFLPVGYFGVDERFGKRRDFQSLVDAAHKRGIAVIIDSVYGHTSDNFPYQYVYDKLGYYENPFMGSFAKDYFGRSTDFNRSFTRDFFFTVNNHWLDCYHIDGFRYDCVPNYWDGALGEGYAALVYETYQALKSQRNLSGYWQRFFDGKGEINLIQCAEQLEDPVRIVSETYSNCTWQNESLGSFKAVAHNNRDELTNLGFRLGLSGYPVEVTNNGDVIKKSALQYLENHDHSRFICNFGCISFDNELLKEGDRSKWFKLQPYIIALFTASGIPMLWQGQELCENYFVPESGWGRVMLHRPVRWDFFYDDAGKALVALVRKMAGLRKKREQFRRGEHYFYNDYNRYQSKGVLLFSRKYQNSFSLVALNFSDCEQSVTFTFQRGGDYIEELHGQDNFIRIHGGDERTLSIPGNYAKIWTV